MKLESKDIRLIEKKMDPRKSILIRNTPRLKSAISDEVADAMHQDRYKRAMPETLEWLRNMHESRGASHNVRIVNTGLIYYLRPQALTVLLDEVYGVCKSLNQPECQIIWATLSQPFENQIQRLDWLEVGIDHTLP